MSKSLYLCCNNGFEGWDFEVHYFSFLWEWLLSVFLHLFLQELCVTKFVDRLGENKCCLITFFPPCMKWWCIWRPPLPPPPAVLQFRGWVKGKVMKQWWQDIRVGQHVISLHLMHRIIESLRLKKSIKVIKPSESHHYTVSVSATSAWLLDTAGMRTLLLLLAACSHAWSASLWRNSS